MKLRTRLFLWIGLIFFLAFGVSLVFETVTTERNLDEAEQDLRQKILFLNEKKRQRMEEFLHVSISEDQALIDSLLLRLSRDPKLGASLFIDPEHLKMIAPAHAAYLYKDDKWINFIQTTKDGNLTSLIIPIDFPMLTSHEVLIDEEISWVVLADDKEVKNPYIGVTLMPKPRKKTSISVSIDEMAEVDWGLLVLFDPKNLATWKRQPPEREIPIEEVNIPAFLNSVERAAQYVKEKGSSLEEIKRDIKEKSTGDIFAGVPFDRGIKCLKHEGEVLNNRIIQLLQQGDQAIMLTTLASLFLGGEFGDTPLSPIAPKGVARFPHNRHTGHLILTDEVFFQTKMFNDARYLASHPSFQECEGLGSSIAIIDNKKMDRVFIGNVLALKGESGKGYITVGIDAGLLLQDLVLAIDQTAFLVHNNTIISAFSADGEPIKDPNKNIPYNPKMLKCKDGVIDWDGMKYYYMHMTPYKKLDLHFFILEKEKSAFALVRSIDEGSKEVIKKVSFNMRIIALVALLLVLILLNRVSRRITKPITALARVTEDVASGRLEGIELPSAPAGRHDEITTLCNSFSKMVNGLKEKEKVKGVLNKVVSPEIAQEIMKGTVHLGGEERKVTVLFADIRNFTRTSATMKPKEVIELLNTCMTRISHVIDEYGGVIDKYVGDEVMALFGAPLEKEDSALKAVQSALKMIQILKEWNEERQKNGLPIVEMGIGIHTGVVLAGNMGAENRLNYTVLGKNVNFSSRLCSTAQPMQILISKETLEEPHVKENIEIEELPPMQLKGFAEPVVLYAVRGERK